MQWRNTFFARHCKAGLDERLFQVSFSPKKSGIQIGFICDVSDGCQTIRYFIKTHQHGPTQDNLKSLKPPDTKELFIYKLIFHLGIGPEVHFVPSHGKDDNLHSQIFTHLQMSSFTEACPSYRYYINNKFLSSQL
jgi:hypothetical protein